MQIQSKILNVIILGLTLTSCRDERNSDKLIIDIEEAFVKNDTLGAKEDILTLVEKYDNNALSFYYKGLLEKSQKQFENALLSFQKAVDLDSSLFKVFVERAKLKIELGDLNSAINDCNRARQINKSYFPIYKTKGTAYEILGDGVNAVVQYESAIEFGDLSGETYYRLGVLQLSFGLIKKGCENLSKSGELGYMDAFDLIKSNCNVQELNNKNFDKEEAIRQKTLGQLKSYPGRFVVTFPLDWKVDEISNSDKSLLFTISAQKEGHFMGILEIHPTTLGEHAKAKSVWEFDKEEFLVEYRNKYDDFKLISDEKKIINGTPAYLFKMSYSFYSNQLQKQLAGITIQYVIFNPRTKLFYYLTGNLDETEITTFEVIYRNTFETFKLL